MTRFYSLVLLSAFIIVSCSKKTKTPTPTPTPAPVVAPSASTFNASNGYIVDAIMTMPSPPFEAGLTFSATKDGKITKVGCKVPTTGPFRISLWDASNSAAPLLTKVVTVNTAGQVTLESITPINISTSKKYIISMGISSARYTVGKDGSTDLFPITVGNIKFEGAPFDYGNVSSPLFPNQLFNSTVYGFPDFEFQAN
jgi:hypothetical protein